MREPRKIYVRICFLFFEKGLYKPARILYNNPCAKTRGISSVGRVPHWQCGCQEFESPMLHHKNKTDLRVCFVLYLESIGDEKGTSLPAGRRKSVRWTVFQYPELAAGLPQSRRASLLCSTIKSKTDLWVCFVLYLESVGDEKGTSLSAGRRVPRAGGGRIPVREASVGFTFSRVHDSIRIYKWECMHGDKRI